MGMAWRTPWHGAARLAHAVAGLLAAADRTAWRLVHRAWINMRGPVRCGAWVRGGLHGRLVALRRPGGGKAACFGEQPVQVHERQGLQRGWQQGSLGAEGVCCAARVAVQVGCPYPRLLAKRLHPCPPTRLCAQPCS